MDEIKEIEMLAKEISMQDIDGYIGITNVDRAYEAYYDYLEKNNLSKEKLAFYTSEIHTAVALYERIWLELLFKDITKNGITENNINAIENHRNEYNVAIEKLINSRKK